MKTITQKSADIETVQAINTETENYEEDSGLWSENSLSHDEVISNGGTGFSIEDTMNIVLTNIYLHMKTYAIASHHTSNLVQYN